MLGTSKVFDFLVERLYVVGESNQLHHILEKFNKNGEDRENVIFPIFDESLVQSSEIIWNYPDMNL